MKKVDAEKSKGTLRTVQPATKARLSASGAGQKGKREERARNSADCEESKISRLGGSK